MSLQLITRDAEDHINWLLEHGWYDKALVELEATQGRKELFEEVSLLLFSRVICREFDAAYPLQINCP